MGVGNVVKNVVKGFARAALWLPGRLACFVLRGGHGWIVRLPRIGEGGVFWGENLGMYVQRSWLDWIKDERGACSLWVGKLFVCFDLKPRASLAADGLPTMGNPAQV